MDRKNYKKIAVAIVKNPEGKFLIVKRKNTKKSIDGSVLEWAFPGTDYEDGYADILKKFVKNETGYDIEPEKEISHRVYHPFSYALTYFESSLLGGEGNPEMPEKITEYKWVEKSDFDNYFSTNVDSGLRKYLGI